MSAKLIHKLQIVLNDRVRFICNVHRYSWKDGVCTTHLSKSLHILPIRFRILYKISLTVFKCLYGNAPCYLKELIVCSQTYCSLRAANRTNRLKPPFSPKYNKNL